MDKIIAGIGEVLWDIFPDGKYLGGAPTNFIYHINRLGNNGVLISSVGNDTNGSELTKELAVKGMKYLLEISEKPTGTVIVSTDTYGSPTYEISENTAWDEIILNDDSIEIAKKCTAVCFGTLPLRYQQTKISIFGFLSNTNEKCLNVCDLNLRQQFYNNEIIIKCLVACDILKINHEERDIIKSIEKITGNDVYFCRTISQKYGISTIILTYGKNGSMVMNNGEVSICRPPKVTIADTVSAGDSFTAGFIHKLTNGHSIREAHRYGTVLSAYVCTKTGGTPDIDLNIIDNMEVVWEQ